MAATDFHIGRVLDRPLGRWWRRTGSWWLGLYILLILTSKASLLIEIAIQHYSLAVSGSLYAVIEVVSKISICAQTFVLAGLWLAVAYQCRQGAQRLFEETAAPGLCIHALRPQLLLVILWQGRWLIAVMLAAAIVGGFVINAYFKYGLIDPVSTPLAVSQSSGISSFSNALGSLVIFLTIYLLTDRRRYVWLLLIAISLPGLYVNCIQPPFGLRGAVYSLVDGTLTEYVGVINLAFIGLMLASLAWGRRYLGWLCYSVLLVGCQIQFLTLRVWPVTFIRADHWLSNVITIVGGATESLNGIGSYLLWEQGLNRVQIVGFNNELHTVNTITGVFFSALINFLWLIALGLFVYHVVLRLIPAVTHPSPENTTQALSVHRTQLVQLGSVLAVSVLVVWQMVPCGYTRPLVGRLPAAPPRVENQRYRIANQRIAAKEIVTGLHEYQADHGEYPPHLFGGGQAYQSDCGWWSTASKRQRYSAQERRNWQDKHGHIKPPDDLSALRENSYGPGQNNPDPLISGGYLFGYPEAWASYYPDDELHDLALPLDNGLWSCMYSTPGDHQVIGGPGPMLYDAIFGSEGERTPLETQAVLSTMDPVDYSDVRHLALGGRHEWHFPLRYNYYYSLFPRKDSRRIEDLYHDAHPLRDGLGMPYFGYQRGEWFGASEREAWLWFYGSNLWPAGQETLVSEPEKYLMDSISREPLLVDYLYFGRRTPLRGLDVLNARTGELKPDGIPDGICLLYKLRDGEVVVIVEADDI